MLVRPWKALSAVAIIEIQLGDTLEPLGPSTKYLEL